jgi:GNAT superfamily N-acetyltransferase
VNTFAFDPAEFSSAVEAVRGALDERKGRGTVRAVYDAKNHQVFQALGFNILGARVWRRRALGATPAVRTMPTDLQVLPLTDPWVDAAKVADCLMDAHAGGIDAHIGLYTPATTEAFHFYSDNLRAGREGKVIDGASIAIIHADMIVAILIATMARGSADRTGASALLNEFAVRPLLRTQGLGAAMITIAFDALARQQFAEVILQHTMGNLAAEKIYHRYGFLSVGDPVLTAHRPD